MARWILAALLVFNAGYFFWSRGDLAALGWTPAALDEREPQRVARQVRPELLQIRRGDVGRPAPAAPAVIAPGSDAGSDEAR